MSQEEQRPETQLKLLVKAESIIQRDAILAALKSQGIEPQSAPRDISRKIADTTVDLSFEGFSAVFDGFAIYVDEEKLQEAEKIAKAIVRTAQKTKDDPGLAQGGSMRRFYFCCLFTITIPILFHGLALYHLYKGLRNKERFHPFYGSMASLVFVVTGVFILYVTLKTDLATFLRGLADTL